LFCPNGKYSKKLEFFRAQLHLQQQLPGRELKKLSAALDARCVARRNFSKWEPLEFDFWSPTKRSLCSLYLSSLSISERSLCADSCIAGFFFAQSRIP